MTAPLESAIVGVIFKHSRDVSFEAAQAIAAEIAVRLSIGDKELSHSGSGSELVKVRSGGGYYGDAYRLSDLGRQALSTTLFLADEHSRESTTP